MRKFSSYGPVSKKIHYYVPRTELIEKAILQLTGETPEEGGHYITVWAPRQCGKTWTMNQTLHRLNEDERFDAVKLELESLKHVQNADEAVAAVGKEIMHYLKLDGPSVNGLDDFEALFGCTRLKKPLILICDEFDALAEDVISGIVGIFRNIYNRRLKDPRPSAEKEYLLHGVALIGVRSVLGIENAKGSPFNVQRSMNIPNLTSDEVRSMFEWYEKESGQKVKKEVIQRVYDETCGQPGLVSWFGELLTETYNRTPDQPISKEDFEYTFKRAIQVLPNNNILNIISKAKQEPYKETVLELFRTDKKREFAFDEPHLNFLYMNGVIAFEADEEKFHIKFSSPFVQKRLFNYFSRNIFQTVDHLYDPMTDIEALLGPDELNIPEILNLYQIWLTRNRGWLLKDAPRRKTDLRIYEAVFHFNLYLYLASFFQDKGGTVYPEFPTGNGKVDLLIRHDKALYALELKSFKDRYGYKQARSQAAKYAGDLKLKRIYLIFFIESIDDKNRRQLETEYHDDETGVDVLPVFLETGNISGWEKQG